MYALWNTNVFENIYTNLLSAAMHLISNERADNSEGMSSNLVIGVRQSFVNAGHGGDEPLELYRRWFEKQYIQHLEDYYKEQTVQVN